MIDDEQESVKDQQKHVGYNSAFNRTEQLNLGSYIVKDNDFYRQYELSTKNKDNTRSNEI